MCTLTLAWQVFSDAPVVVAANRDEALDRPAEPPGRYAAEPTVVAPRDAEAGGTWIGANEHGVFAGVTNRWLDAPLAGERSRGLLVGDVLAHEGAEEAVRAVEREVTEREYDGFNLVVADERAAFLLEWDGHLYVRQFEPGVHVVVNVGASDAAVIPSSRAEYGEQQAEDARRVAEALAPEPAEGAVAWRERAAAVLGDHDYGVCVHGDGYGTRSSSLLTLFRAGASGADGATGGSREAGDAGWRLDYDFADGPPCETEFEPVSASL